MAFPSNIVTRNNHNHHHNHNHNHNHHSIKEEGEKQSHRRRPNGFHEDADTVVGSGSGSGTPIRYVPLCDVYSATSPCVRRSTSGSSNVMSKKVKARKLLLPLVDHFDNGHDDLKPPPPPPPPPFSCSSTHNKPPIVHFYSRRRKRPRCSLQVVVKSENIEDEEEGNNDGDKVSRSMQKKKGRSYELSRLGVDSSILQQLKGPRLRENRNQKQNLSVSTKRGKKSDLSENRQKLDETKMATSGSLSAKRWARLSFEGVDPRKFIGLPCKVFWPLDADWYSGDVVGYNSASGRHQVKYEDGDEEDLIMRNEKTKFYLSSEQMQSLDLSFSVRSSDTDDYDFSEMVVLAASLDDCYEHGPGDIIWAKITGHAMWPAVVVDDSVIGDGIRLKRISGGRPVTVQFFGSYDFARVNTTQVISFLRGLLSSFHQKCKKPNFVKSLEEAKMYLCEQKLPKRMLRMQNGIRADDCDSPSGEDEGSSDSGEECVQDEAIQRKLECLTTCPLEIGDLRVISLGKIVKDSDYFQDERFIWPEGYTAVRKFTSITDPSMYASYKMEVLRDADSMIRPLFKVTTDNGEQFKGSTPSACWNKVYRRIRKLSEGGSEKIFESGSCMFGFSNPEVSKLIQGLSNSKLLSKSSISKLTSGRHQGLHVGYRPVHVQWKDLDKCNVCHMDEEYENNLFLQCDKCRMMVHARCYGELEPVGGVLWFCNLCRPGAPEFPPPCCLCPVIGGAMKPTTDGRWAHLACGIWIPETCLSDIKKMEPIDGLGRINKDRWKLLCSICGVSYGACIQCSNNTCRVAYHPLCARAAGFCVELEDEDRLHLISMDEDEEDQCIRLLSFCKKHRLPSNERSANEERIGQIACQYSDYTPPSNPSGCARSEPYNYFGRRGRKEPEALVAASLKRLFVENRPYLVGGFCQQESFGNLLSSRAIVGSKLSFSIQKLKTSQLDAPKDMLSMAEKYKYMRETFRKRLAFGKSGIHGFGIFAKHPHRAGDMVIEYTGELVRPPIADRREHLIYNSLVGAGTYMFRIDDERVIDATRAGSIAHLINHSCEPNCYSRVISVNRDEHIIIFAKRDIQQWEELTYDYRFFSIDEQLACYCGFPRCRGVVNDIEAEEQVAKLNAPRNELVDWKGE